MPIDDVLLSCLMALQGVELIFLLVSLLLGALAAHVMNSNRFFHSNLRILLRTTGICWILFSLARVASLIDQFIFIEAMGDNHILIKQWPHVIFEAARVYFAAQGAACVVLIIVERIAASISLESYEHHRHTLLTYLFILLAMPFSAFMSFFAFNDIYGYLVAILALLSAIGLIGVFRFIDLWNRHRLMKAINLGLNYSLNERFQLTENIRSADMIFASIIFGCVGVSFPIILAICSKFVLELKYILIVRCIFNLYISVFSIILVLVCVTRPHVWREDFFRRLNNITRLVFCPNRIHLLKKETVRQRIKNADGRQLAFSLDQEAELYFNQLTASWNKSSALP